MKIQHNCFTDPLKRGFSDDGQFISTNYQSLNSTIMNKDKRHLLDLIYRSIDAATAAYYVATVTDFLGEIVPNNFVQDSDAPYPDIGRRLKLGENEKFKSFGKLLMRYLQMTELGFGVFQ